MTTRPLTAEERAKALYWYVDEEIEWMDVDELIACIQKELQAHAAQEAAALRAERDELKAVVEKLQKFKDGAPAYIGDEAFFIDVDGKASLIGKVEPDEDGEGLAVFCGVDGYEPWNQQTVWEPIENCYSTHEAAEAARKEATANGR